MAGVDPTSRRVTVESASREAQDAIRSCEDRAALTCVADALTRYAAALHQIADDGDDMRTLFTKRSNQAGGCLAERLGPAKR